MFYSLWIRVEPPLKWFLFIYFLSSIKKIEKVLTQRGEMVHNLNLTWREKNHEKQVQNSIKHPNKNVL